MRLGVQGLKLGRGCAVGGGPLDLAELGADPELRVSIEPLSSSGFTPGKGFPRSGCGAGQDGSRGEGEGLGFQCLGGETEALGNLLSEGLCHS